MQYYKDFLTYNIFYKKYFPNIMESDEYFFKNNHPFVQNRAKKGLFFVFLAILQGFSRKMRGQ